MEKYGESRGVILTRYRKFLDRKRIRKKLKGSDHIFRVEILDPIMIFCNFSP